jgi:hypothetical protein
MTSPLEEPRSADDLYLARSPDLGGVSVLRPIMTGDIFRGVDIPGVGPEEGDSERLALVVSHPCSMRLGAKLKDHVHSVRVVKCAPIKLNEWPKRFYDRMPLPDLTVIVDPDDISSDDPAAEIALRTQEGAHAALFDLRGRVESSQLALDQRIACLTEQGVAFLYQRMSHWDTRYAPQVEELMAACNPVFAEIDLWEEWNERLVNPVSRSDMLNLKTELEKVAEIFDAELSKKRRIPEKKDAWYVLRDDLATPKRLHAARREILKLLDEYVRAAAETGLSV